MTEHDNGGAAFPRERQSYGHSGMSLRDYFAARAMTVLTGDLDIAWRAGNFDAIAQDAYEFADAMLKAREA